MIKIIETLNKCYNEFNKELFDSELPGCVVNIRYDEKPPKGNYKMLGCFYPQIKWGKDGNQYAAISLTPDAINAGKVQALTTLVHEMSHVYCDMHDIPDVVRKKHTEDFKNVAIMAKLDVEKDKKLGWAMTYPTEELKDLIDDLDIDEEVFDISCSIEYPQKEEKPKKPKKEKFKYVCPSCGRSIVAEEEVLITCKVCQEDYMLKSSTKDK